MQMIKQELAKRTTAVWQPRLQRRLSKEDAREITENITGFFTILAEWSREEECKSSETSTSRGAGA